MVGSTAGFTAGRESRESVPRRLVADLLDAILPARCPGCGRGGALVCSACFATLRAAPSTPPPPPLSWWTSCFVYEGVARELVARAKYRNERRFLALVARELARAVEAAPAFSDIAFSDIPHSDRAFPHIVTWAPASAARIRVHGVDHGELLARAVGRLVGAKVAPCLYRSPGAPQTGLDARARRRGPALRAIGRFPGATILVVDDVATTGGTLAAAARALRAGGACVVAAATIARTPGPDERRTVRAYTPATPSGLG